MIHKVTSDFAAERRLAVTPEIASWTALTFRTYIFRAGQPLDGESVDDEVLSLFLRGSATMQVGEHTWEIDGRADVFSGLPHCVYLPPRHNYRLTPHTDCEVAYSRSHADGRFPPRFIPASTLTMEERGEGNTRHQIVTVLGPDEAEHLRCAEVRTPAGNWSACPLHGHAATLAEVCYHRIDAAEGWAVQRLYTGDRTLDEAVVIRNADAVLVRQSDHPTAAAPDHALYSLHVAAIG